MTILTSPSKSQIRDYLARRVSDRTPPPSPIDIRRQLGWELMPRISSSRKSAGIY